MKSCILLLILFLSFSAMGETPVCQNPGDLVASSVSLPEFQKLCEHMVTNDPGCLRIAQENRLNCDKGQEANRILSSEDILEKVGGCLKGFLFDSVAELAELIIQIIGTVADVGITSAKGLYNFFTDEKFRTQTLSSLKNSGGSGSKLVIEFLKMSAAYFSQEFPKNLSENWHSPLLAFGKTLFEPLVKFLSQAVQGVVSHYIAEYDCLNGPSKVNTICKAVGSLIMPPTALFAFLKGGKNALVVLDKTAEGAKAVKIARANFEALNVAKKMEALKVASALDDTARLGSATTSLGKTLTKVQEEALIKAHNIGLSEGRGYYTYTLTDIRQKERILREAGYAPAEIRVLMEEGIAGRMATPRYVDGARISDDFVETKALKTQAVAHESRITNMAEKGRDISVEMTQFKATQKSIGDGFASEAGLQNNPSILQGSWKAYAKAGDKSSTVASYKAGILRYGMKQDQVLKGMSDDILRLERTVASSPNNPILDQELRTIREAYTELKTFKAPAQKADLELHFKKGE